MVVVAVYGGLGSQMFKYASYLKFVEEYRNNKCVIDTSIVYALQKQYDIRLETLFGIDVENIWKHRKPGELDGVRDIDSYRRFVLNQLHKAKPTKQLYWVKRGIITRWPPKHYLAQNIKFEFLRISKRIFRKYLPQNLQLKILSVQGNSLFDPTPDNYPPEVFKLDGNVYIDEFNHSSDEYLPTDKSTTLSAFRFPDFSDEKNRETAAMMRDTESVAIHIRRGDHMLDNGVLFKNGFFRRSVDYIKMNTSKPVFYIFSSDTEWCKNNLDILGLSTDTDKIRLVDWNTDAESFRDMQLMTYCQHNILAISSFCWWGQYLSTRDNKIVCAPKGYWLDATLHF